MTNLDGLARRLRHAPPNRDTRHTKAPDHLQLTEADFLVFEAIDRHGPLPTHYLFEFVRHVRKDYAYFQHRLTELYNGDKGGSYLTRPPRQFEGFEARYQHVVYDLAPRARVALMERGTLGKFSPKRTDPFLHQLMGACVGASLEIAAKRAGVRYVSREEILTHQKAGACRDSDSPMSVPLRGLDRKTLTPDDLFGLAYPSEGGREKFRFMAVEIDRNTESIERKNLAQTSYGSKVGGYVQVIETKRYQSWWGIPNLSVLTVTTNGTHASNLIEYVGKHGDFLDAFAFATAPAFGANWRVPKQLLIELFEEPWITPVGTKRIDRP